MLCVTTFKTEEEAIALANDTSCAHIALKCQPREASSSLGLLKPCWAAGGCVVAVAAPLLRRRAEVQWRPPPPCHPAAVRRRARRRRVEPRLGDAPPRVAGDQGRPRVGQQVRTRQHHKRNLLASFVPDSSSHLDDLRMTRLSVTAALCLTTTPIPVPSPQLPRVPGGRDLRRVQRERHRERDAPRGPRRLPADQVHPDLALAERARVFLRGGATGMHGRWTMDAGRWTLDDGPSPARARSWSETRSNWGCARRNRRTAGAAEVETTAWAGAAPPPGLQPGSPFGWSKTCLKRWG